MVKLKHKYIFPNIMAGMMKNIDMKTQLEASMMSIFFLLLGMILMSAYTLFYLPQGLTFKILLVFNLLAGFIFMSSSLVTTFQQYISYMDIVDFQGSVNLNPLTGNQIPNAPKKKNRLNQFLFFSGLLGIIVGALVLNNYPTFREEYWVWTSVIMFVGFLMMISVFFNKDKDDKVNQDPIIKDEDKRRNNLLPEPTDEERLREIRELTHLLKFKIDEHKKIINKKEPQVPTKYINPDEAEFYR